MADDDATYAAILRKISTDPRTRRAVTKAIKEVDPEAFPDFSFPDQKVADLEEKLESKLADMEAKRESERIQARLRAQKSKLLEKYDEKQVEAIEKDIMEKHGISDYEIAGKIYASDVPDIEPHRASPAARNGERWSMPEMIEDFRKDPAGAAIRGAYADIDRLRRGERL
jgi:hypothetical protein